jgi:hypothetical protein
VQARQTNGGAPTHSSPVLLPEKPFIDSVSSPLPSLSSAVLVSAVSSIIIPENEWHKDHGAGADGQSRPPTVGQQGLSSAAPSTESAQDSRRSFSQEEEDEKLPTTAAVANLVLETAAENLKGKIPAEILGITSFDIKPSADISSLAQNLGTTLVTLMDKRNVEKSKQTHVQEMVTEWAKKTIPFVETGLAIANVPYWILDLYTNSGRM